jgi:hypothetical protein
VNSVPARIAIHRLPILWMSFNSCCASRLLPSTTVALSRWMNRCHHLRTSCLGGRQSASLGRLLEFLNLSEQPPGLGTLRSAELNQRLQLSLGRAKVFPPQERLRQIEMRFFELWGIPKRDGCSKPFDTGGVLSNHQLADGKKEADVGCLRIQCSRGAQVRDRRTVVSLAVVLHATQEARRCFIRQPPEPQWLVWGWLNSREFRERWLW